jgi:hypothetical protein
MQAELPSGLTELHFALQSHIDAVNTTASSCRA